ncbi:Mu transposase domain-containing protein [Novipirellula herctigrandis]|uniref:Mu transposase domain-containing protein n=1 Tax=Novipirellula herctigrandis TaxID=2527986 RepID=UPI003AF3897F
MPLARFPFYHEVRRKVTRDGHIAVNKAFYSVPPEYLGRNVWVRHNRRLVRILNERMDPIAKRCVFNKVIRLPQPLRLAVPVQNDRKRRTGRRQPVLVCRSYG